MTTHILEQNRKTKTDSQRNRLKEQLEYEVSESVAGDRLSESYREKYRKGKAFEADLSKYNGNAKKVVQKAIDSGILNNTNRSHEFVDLVAKLSAEKGVDFDFTNNDRLKQSGFALEGVTVNGYVSNGAVTVNVNSAKALNSVVGHEITHVLEGTELYSQLQSALFKYAEGKGELQSRRETLEKLYANVEGANIDGELTADLVGDYIFTDADFLRNLSTNHRNVFQKIFDEIKYLYKVATAGSKEARELEKIKKIFEKVYRETDAQKNTAEGGGVKMSISRTKSMSWQSQINGVLYNGKNIRRSDTLVIGNPSNVIINDGVSNKVLAVPVRVVTKATSGKDISHSIKRGKIANLDKGIKNAPIIAVNPDRNAIVYVTNIKQGGLPIVATFEMDAVFDNDDVHQATSIHLQVDTMSLLRSLPNSATIYVQNKSELEAVGATNNLRGLAANIKFTDNIISQNNQNVNSPNSLSAENEDLPTRGYQILGKDVALDEPLPLRESSTVFKEAAEDSETLYTQEERSKRLERKLQRIDKRLEREKTELEKEFNARRQRQGKMEKHYDKLQNTGATDLVAPVVCFVWFLIKAYRYRRRR